MKNNIAAYIICESDINPSLEKVEKGVDGKAIGEGIIQTADERNRNGRYYAEEELFPQLTAPRTKELLAAGYLRAEMGHPLSKDLARQSVIDDKITCARFLTLWTEGKNIWARFKGTNNEYGRAFDLDLKEGCKPAWSLRALGSVVQTSRGAEVKNLRVITWDNVIYPSHPGAYTQRIVSESLAIANEAVTTGTTPTGKIITENDLNGVAMITPIKNEQILNFLQEQSGNLKFIKECFDFVYKDIVVNERGTKVFLTTNEGETLVVPMESYIHNELMNYASKRLNNNN
jgi:hypothetical protein